MSDQYVPTDQRVRHTAITEGAWLAYAPESFDRWIAAHDAKVRADTLEEAKAAIHKAGTETLNGPRRAHSIPARTRFAEGIELAKDAIRALRATPTEKD